ncbi:hypothetical protein BJ944DRAFT_279159 [Cunninghamella echinulata]|nr:hypothetical protein BJ944DRAFT_279159 [Cunninghamella echinulata]
MSDIEVLDITTWSWTSFYTPSQEYINFGETNSTNDNDNHNSNNVTKVDSDEQNALTSSNSTIMMVVAGAIIGILAVFFIIIIILFIIKYRRRQKTKSSKNNQSHQPQPQFQYDKAYIIESPHPTLSNNTLTESLTTSPTSLTSPLSPFPISPQLPMQPMDHPTRKMSQASLPSPWEHHYHPHNCIYPSFHNHNYNNKNIYRAATTSGYRQQHQISSNITLHEQPRYISKPDEEGPYNINHNNVKRAMTITTPLQYSNNKNESINKSNMDKNHILTNDHDDISFDRQEFILHSEELSDLVKK